MRNSMKAWLLMAALTVLLVLVGDAIGGRGGAQLFLFLGIGMNFFGYWFSDKIAIAMTHSKAVSEQEAPQLYATVRRVAQKANLPMPRVYVSPSPQPNAFATGRNPQHAAVAVTEGILRILSQDELEGVLAHEMAHVKNRDILIASLAAVIAGAITMIADIARWGLIFGAGRNDDEDNGAGAIGSLFMIILAPIAAVLIQLAISRSREYLADETGARIIGRGDGLANALLKLERGAQMIPMDVSPSTAHLFIVNPLSAGQAFVRLFSTHPPISERVERLRRLDAHVR